MQEWLIVWVAPICETFVLCVTELIRVGDRQERKQVSMLDLVLEQQMLVYVFGKCNWVIYVVQHDTVCCFSDLGHWLTVALDKGMGKSWQIQLSKLCMLHWVDLQLSKLCTLGWLHWADLQLSKLHTALCWLAAVQTVHAALGWLAAAVLQLKIGFMGEGHIYIITVLFFTWLRVTHYFLYTAWKCGNLCFEINCPAVIYV